MFEIDIFGSSNPRSAGKRLELINARTKISSETTDFLSYGYDYFDNKLYGVGYGGYVYDGRYAPAVQMMITNYSLKPGMKVLEVGCAKGFILFEFFKLDYYVKGVDLSQYAVDNSIPSVKPHLLCQSCIALPFLDDEFDFVYSKEMLPHLSEEEIELAILELMRVTKGNSIFLEIQVSKDTESAELINKWDRTHKTVRTAKWWKNKLNTLQYEGGVNFKSLF